MNILFIGISSVFLPTKAHLIDKNVQLQKNIFIQKKTKKEYFLEVTFEPVAVSLINRLCEKTSSKIVIHSDWRRNFTHEEIKNKLISEGIKEEYLHENCFCTLRLTSNKLIDIKQWLNDNRVNSSPTFERPIAVEHFYKNKKDYNDALDKANLFDSIYNDFGINYVVLDSVPIFGDNENQVFTNEIEGFTTVEYRIACALLNGEDDILTVDSFTENEMDVMKQHHFINKFEFFDWIYRINDAGVLRASLLSRKRSDIEFQKYRNTMLLSGMKYLTSQEFYDLGFNNLLKELHQR